METDAFKKNERIWLGIKKLLFEEYITYGLKSIAKCVKKYFPPTYAKILQFSNLHINFRPHEDWRVCYIVTFSETV